MAGPSGAVRVMLATQPADFRKGMDDLAMLVRKQLRGPLPSTSLKMRRWWADGLPTNPIGVGRQAEQAVIVLAGSRWTC